MQEISFESTIEKNILKYLNSLHNCKAVKWSQNGRQKGNPDIICAWNGIMFLFEVKRPGEFPTRLQQATIDEWRAVKVTAVVVHSAQEVKDIMDEVMRTIMLVGGTDNGSVNQ